MSSINKSPRQIRITNTMTGKKELLLTGEPGKLTFYSCGPTVYGLIHIGNLRTALVSDMFFRYFQRAGYEVIYVRNYTDVDDKIIQRANQEGVSADELARRFTGEVEKDYAYAGMLEPTYKTTVTTHMPEIVAMIDRIIANGKAYVVDGEVLFSINDFPGYGKLSHKHPDDLLAGARVEVNEKKRNPLDFTLWKPAKPGEPSWDSPWGKGRPGWHIECSAMACKWLGDRIDIHHGATDLIFPHHENEIAQSESASGKEPFVRYWVHNAFLNFGNDKMSKSLGNIVSARDFLARVGGEVARAMMLTVHYRSPIDFGEDLVDQALTSLHRIYEAKTKAIELRGRKMAVPDMRAEAAWGSFVSDCEKAKKEIDENFANDFNTPGAMATLFTLIREFNRTLGEPLAAATPAAVLGAEQLIRVMEEDIGGVLGIGRSDPEKVLKQIESIRASRPARDGGARPNEEEIFKAIQARAEARRSRDFAEADRIRKDLEARGVMLKDGPGGTSWEYT